MKRIELKHITQLLRYTGFAKSVCTVLIALPPEMGISSLSAILSGLIFILSIFEFSLELYISRKKNI